MTTGLMGDLIGLYRSFETLPQGKDRNEVGAILAAITAERSGGWLLVVESNAPFTLLSGPLRRPNQVETIVLPYQIESAAVAVSYWQVTGQNLLTSPDSALAKARDDFVGRAVLGAWSDDPASEDQRWAAAALSFDALGSHRAVDRETELKRRREALASALRILAKSLGNLYPNSSTASAERDLAARLESIASSPLIEPKVARDRWGSRIAPAVSQVVPLDVLSHRGVSDLSLAQALTWFLVEDPSGPRLTHALAAEALGMERRQEVGTHLARAKEKLERKPHLLRSRAREIAMKAESARSAQTLKAEIGRKLE